MSAESTPRLTGVRVLVTRPRERAAELCFLLEDEGADVIFVPALELLPPTDDRPFRAAVEILHRYAWIAFASPSAVRAVVDAAREAATLPALRRLKVAAVGPLTARTALESGLVVTLEAERTSSGGLADALLPHLMPDDEVLLPAAQDGRRELEETLDARGIQVTRVVAYRSEAVAIPAEVWAQLAAQPPAAAIFASPRSAEAFVQAAGEPGRELLRRCRTVAIGPTTAEGMIALGLPPTKVAARPSAEALVEAVVQAMDDSGASRH